MYSYICIETYICMVYIYIYINHAATGPCKKKKVSSIFSPGLVLPVWKPGLKGGYEPGLQRVSLPVIGPKYLIKVKTIRGGPILN